MHESSTSFHTGASKYRMLSVVPGRSARRATQVVPEIEEKAREDPKELNLLGRCSRLSLYSGLVEVL